jgi:hypothetical protein
MFTLRYRFNVDIPSGCVAIGKHAWDLIKCRLISLTIRALVVFDYYGDLFK